jgi:hypothetical protein
MSCPPAHPDSVLLVTLDSCRFDTFAHAELPAMKAIAPLRRAKAPSHFTFGSHAAMFVGFTPGVAEEAAPFVNPKFGRLFRLSYAGHPGKAPPGFTVSGRNIVEGFRAAGYATFGSAAMGWFDPATEVSGILRDGFEAFHFAADSGVEAQLTWLDDRLAQVGARPVFVFLNVGETHVPYHHKGAPWSREDNPCQPFQQEDRSEDCRARQTACAEYVDARLAPLLRRFSQATTLLCADHGDCWGEDGLWEHGVSHEMTLSVPLMIRYRGEPI